MHQAIDSFQRAAVAMSASHMPTSGARITVQGAVAGMRLWHDNLQREQADLVELYADALRRAEGRASTVVRFPQRHPRPAA